MRPSTTCLLATLAAGLSLTGCVTHRAPQLLARDLQSPSAAKRSAAAREMAEGAVHSSVSPYALAALRREPYDRTFADLLVGLAQSGTPCALPAIEANLDHQDEVIRAAAKKADAILREDYPRAVSAVFPTADPRALGCATAEDMVRPATYSAPPGPPVAHEERKSPVLFTLGGALTAAGAAVFVSGIVAALSQGVHDMTYPGVMIGGGAGALIGLPMLTVGGAKHAVDGPPRPDGEPAESPSTPASPQLQVLVSAGGVAVRF
jgi:hypothetical protein